MLFRTGDFVLAFLGLPDEATSKAFLLAVATVRYQSRGAFTSTGQFTHVQLREMPFHFLFRKHKSSIYALQRGVVGVVYIVDKDGGSTVSDPQSFLWRPSMYCSISATAWLRPNFSHAPPFHEGITLLSRKG
jgi:hypothetical protein